MSKRPARKVKHAAAPTVRVLFTCAGRRVELVRAFQRAAEKLGLSLTTHGADVTQLAPAMHCVDRAHIVPPIASADYVPRLLDLVKRRRIDLLVPLLDAELTPIADAREEFRSRGCVALISSPQVVRACRDKLLTFHTLRDGGIDTPETWTWSKAIERAEHHFPYYLKPRSGSAAMGNYIVANVDELRTFGLRVRDAIVQEYVEGWEHTIDVYTGLDGVPRCAVPRKRLEVRTGEVSKGVVVKDPRIMAVGIRVAEMLGACRGVITVQCMVTPAGRIRVIEVNPRFGGGVPLSIHVGADFPRWILQEWLGRRPRIRPDGFRDDVAMLRFDDSVFVPRASRLLE